MKDFDIFRNTDDMTVEMIAGSYPVLTDEEKERMFAMSERKFNIKERKYPQGYTNDTAITDEEDEDEVNGVEEYDRPLWLKFISTAAALMLIGGGLAVGRNLLRRRPAPDNVTPPNIATAVVTGSQTTAVTGADNVTYTIDVDAMLTGLETTAQAPEAAAATTAAAPAATEPPTQAPTAPAPTEAPTEAQTEPYDEEAYQKIVKDLLQNEMYLWEITSDMENNYYDINRDNIIKTQYVDSNTGETWECEYIEMIHPIFKSVDDMWAMARNTYTDIYATEYFGNVFKALEIYPGKIQTEADIAPYGIYDGKLYCRYSAGYLTEPLVYDHYEAPTERALITVSSDNAFQAAIPFHAVRKNGEEVVLMEEMLVVRENGKWLIDGYYSWRGGNMSYEDYLAMIAQQ